MLQCFFELNDKPMSTFKIAAISVPAFSGQGINTNKRISVCLVGQGPIPPGEYYIFDRQGGGRLEWLRNMFSDHSDWFALYAIDGKVDDETFCEKVKRGHFRLHPKGPRGLSEGCITLENHSDFMRIRALLKSVKPSTVPGTELKAYGKVLVK